MKKKIIYLIILFCLFLNIAISEINASDDKQTNNIENFKFEENNSIFFTEAETNVINKSYEIFVQYKSFLDNDIVEMEGNTKINNNKNESFNVGVVKLNSILFINRNNWTVWINNIPINSTNNSINAEFFVSYIDKNKVEIKWKMNKVKFDFINQNNNISPSRYFFIDNKVELNFYLSANQTYLSHIDTIIDGDYNYEKLNKDDKGTKNNNLNININEKEIDDLLNTLKEEKK